MRSRSLWDQEQLQEAADNFNWSWLEARPLSEHFSHISPPVTNETEVSPSDDPFFTVVNNSIQASYITGTSDSSTDLSTAPGSQATVTSGGIVINLLFDNAAMAAPASFRAGIQQAVGILAANITDKITVNLKIDYSGTGGGAAAGPDGGLYESYSWVHSQLTGNASPGDTSFSALPNGTTIQGKTSVAVWNAQLKLWGVVGANDTTTDDGSATFATDISPNLLVGVALHELTHALGRVPYGSTPDIFDFYRMTGIGNRLFLGGSTAPAAYFSLDGGITKLADYGMTSDPSDFLNSGVQGPNDPFNEFYLSSTTQGLSAVDLKQLNALGFHLATQDTHPPTLTANNVLSAGEGSTTPISTTFLSAVDDFSNGANLRFDVISNPVDGALLVNGSPANAFTEADLLSGMVSYKENVPGAHSDSFHFVVTDAAGNQTPTQTFTISIGPAFATSSILPSMPGWTAIASVDVNGDGTADVLWKSGAGELAAWLMNSGQIVGVERYVQMSGWQVAATGDLDRNGATDVIWQSGSGEVASWMFSQGKISSMERFPQMAGWTSVGYATDASGAVESIWRSSTSQVSTWSIVNGQVSANSNLPPMPGWTAIATGDFDHNGSADVLWQSGSGELAAWMMLNGQLASITRYPSMPGWHVAAAADLNHDGTTDILWVSDAREIASWMMSNSGQLSSIARYGSLPDGNIISVGDYYHLGETDLLVQNASSVQVLSLDHHLLV
ncbi:NF038122 family metalloprotease [Bradyrhizobium sp. USDA 4353]